MIWIRPKVVFDCNVLLQAVARQNGPAAECLRLVERNSISLFISKPVLQEVRLILTDAVVRSKNLALSDEIVAIFLRKVTFKGTLVRTVPQTFDYPRDPKDEKYIDLAVAADAEFLVSRDNDLLDLMTGHSLLAKQFRQKFSGLAILNPVEFLTTLRRINPDVFKS